MGMAAGSGIFRGGEDARSEVPVVQLGLGSIGQSIVRHLLRLGGVRLVGAVDPAPEVAGRDLGELVGEGPLGVTVAPNFDPKRHGKAAVALHAATSFAAPAVEQLLGVVEAGIHVISTCEQLSWPWYHHPTHAHRLDRAARSAGVTVLATGVNPGFVMDLLPLVLSGVCTKVERVYVRRVVDVSRRRGALQRKVGCGLSPEAFKELAGRGRLGHVGLPESAALVASGLGWRIDSIEERIEPVLAATDLRTEHVSVAAGQVQGVHQVAVVRTGGAERIRLDLGMALRPSDVPFPPEAEGRGVPRGAVDFVCIDGEPGLQAVVPGGVFGDTATVAAVVNAIPRVLEAPAGLLSVKDLPAVAHWTGLPAGLQREDMAPQ
mgnify:CR=1 FL=1